LLEHYTEYFPALFGRRQKGIGGGHRYRNRFFGEDVQAGFEGRDSDFVVEIMGGCD
jgi:hypothetical protein